MRETEVSQFVAGTVPEVERALTPPDVIEYEGSFDVFDIQEEADATVVTAGARGLRLTLRFQEGQESLYYEQVDDAGPFDEMWTNLSWTRVDEGTRVTARSAVSLGLPLATVTDRVAAWKRRGELRRALRRLAEDVR